MTLAVLIERIAAKVTPNKRGCLLWNGAMSQSGWRGTFYPVIRIGKKVVRVNRLVLLLDDVSDNGRDVIESIEEAAKRYVGVESSHGCDDSRCIRRKHLEWKTHADNIGEQVERRRSSR